MPSKTRRYVSESTKKLVAGRQEYQCNNKPYLSARGCETHECLLWKKKINPGNFDAASYEVDHIIGLNEGGTNDISNLQALCPNCHSFKTKNNINNKHQTEIVEEMDVESEDDIINIEITNKTNEHIIAFMDKYTVESEKGRISWIELKKKFIKWCRENNISKYKKLFNEDLEKLFIKFFKTNPKMIKINNKLKKGWLGYRFK